MEIPNIGDIFHGFHVLKTQADAKLILVYPLSHITQILVYHQWIIQNIQLVHSAIKKATEL